MLGFVVKSGHILTNNDVLWYNAAFPEEDFTISLWKFGWRGLDLAGAVRTSVCFGL